MTGNPIYDYPEPYANPRRGAVASPQKISLVGRLRLTQPVWLQLGINSATALHILQQEPPGTFLVRRSNTRQCQVLCLRLPDNSSPAFVTTYGLCQEPTAISLEGSNLTFPSLLHLIAASCSAPDILPLSLRLPQPIWKASSCQQLEAIAHLGLEFWSSSLNAKGLSRPSPPVPVSHADPDPRRDARADPQGPSGEELARGKPTRACGFANPSPAGLSPRDVGVRRQHFKNSVKVRVSTEAASPLSPPAAPPPPIPVGKKKPLSRAPQFPALGRGSRAADSKPPPQVSTQATARLDTYCVPSSSNQGAKEKEAVGQRGAPFIPISCSAQLLQVTEEEQPEGRGKEGDPDDPPWGTPAREWGALGNGVRGGRISPSEPS
ncbi:ras and Rab interactor 1 [Hemicordylus capensis]|uniref:ras and Rab interactor 1 n=1 Tax=Hemicordylus capensis TaxID=884348 RepID=UPI00230278B8|nr:ras and Rab interactor 1 [Hemicordylus capensis]XP_053134075.1 ras and Rab interactor 1 [Hemicordylus capensis]XP_053134076.1 ras and Rab interactor 1 [Hemicordylus capensis]XP_053134077.1 ras and Rab interactor 1 [Hemicordylus capensis]